MKLYNEYWNTTSVNRIMKWGYLGSIDTDVKAEDIVNMLTDAEVLDEVQSIPNCNFSQIEHNGDFYRVYKVTNADGQITTRVYKMLPTVVNDNDFEWERKLTKGCNAGRVYYFGKPKFFTGVDKYYAYYYLDSGEVKICNNVTATKPRLWISCEYAENKYIKAAILTEIAYDLRQMELALEGRDDEWIDVCKGVRYSAIPEH